MCTAVEYRPYTGWSMEKCCHTRRCATITSQHGRTRNDTWDLELAMIEASYAAGELTCGEVKAKAAAVVSEVVTRHQEARQNHHHQRQPHPNGMRRRRDNARRPAPTH